MMVSRVTAPLSRRTLLKLGGAAAAASTLGLGLDEGLANGDTPSKPVAVKRGGTFRVRMNQPPVHFDPHQTAAYSTMVPLSFAYNRLVKVQNGSSVAPGTQPIEGDLADSWDRQGGTGYAFQPRKGIRWHPQPPGNRREPTADGGQCTSRPLPAP